MSSRRAAAVGRGGRTGLDVAGVAGGGTDTGGGNELVLDLEQDDGC